MTLNLAFSFIILVLICSLYRNSPNKNKSLNLWHASESAVFLVGPILAFSLITIKSLTAMKKCFLLVWIQLIKSSAFFVSCINNIFACIFLIFATKSPYIKEIYHLCPIYVVTFSLILGLVRNYIQKRRG